MSRLEEQIQATASHLRVEVTLEEHEAARQRFDVLQRRRKRKRIAASGIAVGAVLGLVMWAQGDRLLGPPQVPLMVAEDRSTQEAPVPKPFKTERFADGSIAVVQTPSTQLQTTIRQPDLHELRLTSGRARFTVTPNPQRVFRVLTRHARIEVLGTSFTVDENEDGARVEVHEGRVVVITGAERQELGAGMTLEVKAQDQTALAPDVEEESPEEIALRAELAESAEEEAQAESERRRRRKSRRARRARARSLRKLRALHAKNEMPVAEEEPEEAEEPREEERTVVTPKIPREGLGTPPPARRTVWRSLAKSGDYRAAYTAMKEAPAPVLNQTAELMLAADVARLSGHPVEAVPFLQRVMDDHPKHPRAVLAAFTLGRIQRRQLGHPRKAAESFAKARQLAPNGSLAADALAHEAECLQMAGEKERAQNKAKQYLKLFPQGRKADSMRRMGGAP